ncbi:MAG: hypothetical protein ACK45H_03615 [Bacteroidota bacterium]
MGEIDQGLESGEIVQAVGRFWCKKMYFGALLFVMFALILLLPFRHEHTEGNYGQLLGEIGYSVHSDKYTSGYQEPVVVLGSVFYLLTLGLFVLAKKRMVFIFSVITAFLNLLSLPLIYFALTFILRFSGPPVIVEVSYGYYALVIIDVLLVLTVFLVLRDFRKCEERSYSDELLDH